MPAREMHHSGSFCRISVRVAGFDLICLETPKSPPNPSNTRWLDSKVLKRASSPVVSTRRHRAPFAWGNSRSLPLFCLSLLIEAWGQAPGRPRPPLYSGCSLELLSLGVWRRVAGSPTRILNLMHQVTTKNTKSWLFNERFLTRGWQRQAKDTERKRERERERESESESESEREREREREKKNEINK